MRNNNATFIGKQRDNVNKAKPPPSFSCCCRNLKSEKTKGGGGGVKSAVEVTVYGMEQRP